ncbi:hypothetical protein [Streptomyces capitiformicae]|uniref:Uncharacterized protein n=1 Tax=Streptomyces capitiformicae TaxID=2014920 RepID=A0A919GFR9_9ACTN|nr:hypothetical protein [Streptomyces capitiformicae]GHH83264.1 hypothetical protein GCM10017771_09630 [Streptomyces capitiformicae]
MRRDGDRGPRRQRGGRTSHLGDHTRAVHLLAAGTRWRAGHPRPFPEHHEAEHPEAAALTALGRTRYDAEHTTGSTPTHT